MSPEQLPHLEASVLAQLDAIAATWAPSLIPGQYHAQPIVAEVERNARLIVAFGMTESPQMAHMLAIGHHGVGAESLLSFEYHSSRTLQHPAIATQRYTGDYEWAYMHALWTDERVRGQGFGSMNLYLMDKILARRAQVTRNRVLALAVDQSATGWSEAILGQLGFQNAQHLPISFLRVLRQQLRFYKAY